MLKKTFKVKYVLPIFILFLLIIIYDELFLMHTFFF